MSKQKNTQKLQSEQQVQVEQQTNQQHVDDSNTKVQEESTTSEVEVNQTKTDEVVDQMVVDHTATKNVDNVSNENNLDVTNEPVVTSVAPKDMAKQQAQNAMSIYIDRIKKDGVAGEKMVVDTMESYLAVMGTGKPLDTATIVREQTRLYTMFKNIGRRVEDFRKAVVVTRFFFRENAEGAFHDIRINRGHEALQLSADDRKAFYSYLQLYKIIASVNDLKDVKKSVDVSRSLTNPVIPAEVKERYVSLFN